MCLNVIMYILYIYIYIYVYCILHVIYNIHIILKINCSGMKTIQIQ
jgi:hypothetical protein